MDREGETVDVLETVGDEGLEFGGESVDVETSHSLFRHGDKIP